MNHLWNAEEVHSLKSMLRKNVKDIQSEEDCKEAKVVAKILTEISSEDPEAWYYLGLLSDWLGELNEATKSHFRSLELGGSEFLNYSRLMNICRKNGELEKGIQWGYKALECNPDFAAIYHEIAELHILVGDTPKAVKLLESQLKIVSISTKEKFATLIRLGDICTQIDRMKKALNHYKSAQKLNPSDESLWTSLGHCLSRSGDKEGALNSFKKAVSVAANPNNLYNLGDSYLALGKPEKAIAPLIEATRKDPGYSLAYYDLSLAFLSIKKYTEGAGAAIAALRPDPEMKLQLTNLGIGAMTNLGLCLMNMRRFDEALESFKRNLKLLGKAHLNIGLVYFRMKNYKEALTHFKKGMDLYPEDPEHLNLVGQTYTELGKYKTGERYLRKSLKKNPDYAESYYDLGVLFSRIKAKKKEALRYFMKAIELDPNMEWAYYSLACIYALSGDKEQALNYLKQSLEKGLSDKNHIDSDSDMDTLRDDKKFIRLINKYFPEK